MKASFKQRLRCKLLEYFGLSWFTLHDSVRHDLEVLPSLIGSSASAKALAYYLIHYEELSGDEKLADQIGNSITFFTRTHVVER